MPAQEWERGRLNTERHMGELVDAFTVSVDNLAAAMAIDVVTDLDLINAFDGFPWEELFNKPLKAGWTSMSGKTIESAGVQAMRDLGIDLKFTVQNPFSQSYLKDNAATRVRGVTRETQQAIRTIMEDGFREGIPTRSSARRIQETVGLDVRSARAVVNRRRKLELKGKSQAEIERAADAYRKRLLKRRAENIARTESIAAHAEGTMNAWEVAEKSGDLPTGLWMKWIASGSVRAPGRTCPICIDLNQRVQPLRQPWYSRVLGRKVWRPPAHPSCRCSVGLIRKPKGAKPNQRVKKTTRAKA